jgi:hypothetical protein
MIVALLATATLSGCISFPMWGTCGSGCDPVCETCPEYGGYGGCQTCETCPTCDPCGAPCGGCGLCGGCGGCGCSLGSCLTNFDTWLYGKLYHRSGAVPDTLPLGSTVRTHYQIMETNAEAVDFIVNLNDFVGETAELTPDGKDHILEIAARMRSAPFPVVIERSMNNSNPELDLARRNLIAQILCDLGNPDAQQRTVVATPYGPGYLGIEAETMYYQHVLSNGGFGNNNNFGGGFNSYGGGFGGF